MKSPVQDSALAKSLMRRVAYAASNHPGARNGPRDSLAGLLAGTADDRIVPPLSWVLSSLRVPRKLMVPLPVAISRATELPMMKLPDGNAPGVIVPELKQGVLRVTVPSSPKLPSELGVL